MRNKMISKTLLAVLVSCSVGTLSTIETFASNKVNDLSTSNLTFDYQEPKHVKSIAKSSSNALMTCDYFSRVWESINSKDLKFETYIELTSPRSSNYAGGWMGAITRAYTMQGALYASGEWRFNNDGYEVGFADDIRVQAPGYFYGSGSVMMFNGDGYDTYETGKTPFIKNPYTGQKSFQSNMTDITDDFTSIKYEINKNGETYGLGIYEQRLGMPDLVKAVGIDGTIGYVRSKELNLNLGNTPEENLKLQMQNKNKPNRKLNLYDKDGQTVIGEFEIQNTDK